MNILIIGGNNMCCFNKNVGKEQKNRLKNIFSRFFCNFSESSVKRRFLQAKPVLTKPTKENRKPNF